MTKQTCEEIARLWMLAFNEHQIENLLELYHENAIHFSPKLKERKPETNGLIIGKIALRDWWTDAFLRLPSLSYEPVQFISDEHNIFMDYIRHVDGALDLRVGELLKIENGKIIESRVYHS